MVSRLIKAGITTDTHAEAHASFDVAFEAIRSLDAERWTKYASDASHAKAQSLGAQLGWIPRDYSGCPQVFKSMQIDVCLRLDAMDMAEGPARRVAQEALIAEIRRHLTRGVLGADMRQRGRTDAVRTAPVEEAAPF
jgi:hypothetical protein